MGRVLDEDENACQTNVDMAEVDGEMLLQRREVFARRTTRHISPSAPKVGQDVRDLFVYTKLFSTCSAPIDICARL